MKNSNLFSRKNILIVLVLVTIMVAVVVVFAIKRAADNTSPVETKVVPGKTISSAQIDQQDKQTDTTTAVQQPAPSNDTFYNAIVQSGGIAPDSQGHVSFGIVSTKNPQPGWYIVTIRSGNLSPAEVIFKQTNDPNNPLTIVAGPGTSFPPEYVSLPDEVRKAL